MRHLSRSELRTIVRHLKECGFHQRDISRMVALRYHSVSYLAGGPVRRKAEHRMPWSEIRKLLESGAPMKHIALLSGRSAKWIINRLAEEEI